MHYDIMYKDLENPKTIRKACADALDYLGSKRYRLMAWGIKRKAFMSFEQFCFILSFGGVQGFPATAMWKRYGD